MDSDSVWDLVLMGYEKYARCVVLLGKPDAFCSRNAAEARHTRSSGSSSRR